MGITAGLPRKDLEHTGFKYPRILLLGTRGFRDTGDCRAQHGQEWKSLAIGLSSKHLQNLVEIEALHTGVT